MVKNSPDNAGDARDAGLIPESGRSHGIGNSNPLKYSCLENSMDREAGWLTVHGDSESDTLSTHACTSIYSIDARKRSPRPCTALKISYWLGTLEIIFQFRKL